MMIGHLKEITRHPVKSFGGESIEKTQVMNYGLYGDRSHAIKDLSRENNFLTITQFPRMAQYKAAFISEESELNFPEIQVTTPDQKVYNWKDPALMNELEAQSERKLLPIVYEPMNVPIGAIEEEHILLVTDSSIKELQNIWGKELDYKRFRPNLLFSLHEKNPFIEEDWFGKKIKIGKEVELKILRHCQRCMIVNVDPTTGITSSTLLKTLVKQRNNHFGVYASVLKTGEINVGDQIQLLD
ncbi:MOSC domain-containing protein [Metabacillus litoralis]|uniref:MOSC domain-containing protein n=1 Tax=Metabacillus litoralis TaxID=152268 RepID=UPI001CFCDAD0|nr:MOSC domain-containing protein [Metabacillus litoralis]